MYTNSEYSRGTPTIDRKRGADLVFGQVRIFRHGKTIPGGSNNDGAKPCNSLMGIR